MAYKLKDANGRFVEMNGMHKGTINKNYKYQGMSAWNDSSYGTYYRPFYSTYRRVYIDGTYYQVSSTSSSSPTYIANAYGATSVAIVGRYNSSSYKAYEVYVDGTLVASGDYTSSAATIYTLTKSANSCITIEGTYVNSVMTYNITTNTTIWRSASYEWDNGVVKTASVTIKITPTEVSTTGYPYYVTTPTLQELYDIFHIDEDCIISHSVTQKFYGYYSSSSSGNVTFYYRTDQTYGNVTTLPGSSLGSVYCSSSSRENYFSKTGDSYLGKTYYIYQHYSTYQSGLYYPCRVASTNWVEVTFTLKYREITDMQYVDLPVTRTNAYSIPSLTESLLLTQTKNALHSNITSDNLVISKYIRHVKIYNKSSSTVYYYTLSEGSTTVSSAVYLSYGSYKETDVEHTYGGNLSAMTLKYGTSSSSITTNGSDSAICFSNVSGENYIRVYFTFS